MGNRESLKKGVEAAEAPVEGEDKKAAEERRNQKIGAFLKTVPVFARLTDAERILVAGALFEKKFKAGKDIITQGTEGKEFFILKSGSANVIKIDKEEIVLAELHEGDHFGEQALMTSEPRKATVRAVAECVCLTLEVESFQKLFGKDKLNIKFAKRNAILADGGVDTKEKDVVDAKVDRTKTKEELAWLRNAVGKNVLFSNLESEQLEQVIASMYKLSVKSGDSIIRQGEAGDNFYVVQSGEFDIFKAKKKTSVAKTGKKEDEYEPAEKVNHAGAGACFGELSLMYNAPRAATVVAVSDAVVWAVDRHTFRKNLAVVSQAKLSEYEAFLKDVPVLSSLIRSERVKVAEALEEKIYTDGQLIVKQGEEGDSFFLIRKGTVVVTKEVEGEVNRLHRGDFFGERALIKNEPRAATVAAVGPVECLVLNQHAFTQLLGPLKEIMDKDSEYAKATSASRDLAEKRKSAIGAAVMAIKKTDLVVVGTLGRGSFGLVQLVKHKVTGQTFALKQVSKAQIVQLGQQEHIMSEKNVMMQFNHPFLIKLHATFNEKDFLYFLLEVCLGGELFTYLRQKTLFDETTSKFYAGSVVLAFEYMHERNIVYRDLKPENLLLDPEGYLKIADFGFAKVVLDRTYTLCGTPDYLAPEVIIGQGHGKGVDWWTLGVLIFEMLASYPPFFDEDPMKTYAKIMHAAVEFPKHFSKEAVDLITGLLHPKATKRLGVLKGGAKKIKAHPWFKGFDWDALYRKEMKTPFVPEVKGLEDLSNFAELGDDDEMDFPPYEDDGTGWDKEF